MNSGRRQDDGERYRAILETAARLICERGYEGTSMQEIAAACHSLAGRKTCSPCPVLTTKRTGPNTQTSQEPPCPPLRQSSSSPWTVPEDTGRRYARASGDYNPIHLHALSARLFGFPRAIAHGMWTVGRCVAEMGEAAEAPALTLSSVFRRPLLLPSRVVFQTAAQRDGTVAYRVKSEDGQPHVMGELTHLPSPSGRGSG